MGIELFWLLIKRTVLEYETLSRSVLTHRVFTYLLFGVTVAAHGPKIFQSSPQEDYEKTPKESHHGGGEESPPHPLAVAVTGHIWGKWDDHIHPGNVDRGVRVEFIPIFRHFFFSVPGRLPASTHKKSSRLGIRRLGELRPAPPDAPSARPCLNQPPAAPLPSHLSPLAGSKSWIDSRQTPRVKND